MATIFMQLYKQPLCTHSKLAGITGITLSGVAKNIHMLKKRGLVQRTAYQTYMLTAKAISMIEEEQ